MDMFGFDLTILVFWHWLVIAGVFLVLEVLSMSFFFLWLGVSAGLVGGILLALPDTGWHMQFVLWAGLSVLGVIAGRVYKKRNPNSQETDEPALNRRGQQYVGRVFTLIEPVVNGFGKVKVDDSTWKIECGQNDIAAGQKVRVIRVDGTVLQAEVVND